MLLGVERANLQYSAQSGCKHLSNKVIHKHFQKKSTLNFCRNMCIYKKNSEFTYTKMLIEGHFLIDRLQ